MRFSTIVLLSAFSMLFASCSQTNSNSKPKELNLILSKEIDKMADLDRQMQLNMMQFATGDPQELENVERIRSQVYEKHAKRIAEIVNEYGYPSYDLVGKKSTENFHTLTIHASDFQDIRIAVLKKMKEKRLTNNISRENFVSLTDELASEQGLPTLYGTIIDFNEQGQAYLKGHDNFNQVDSNRIAIGLDPIKPYLNNASYQYYKQNEEAFKRKGVNQAVLYE